VPGFGSDMFRISSQFNCSWRYVVRILGFGFVDFSQFMVLFPLLHFGDVCTRNWGDFVFIVIRQQIFSTSRSASDCLGLQSYRSQSFYVNI